MVERLVDFLPTSVVRERDDGSFYLDYDLPKSIGYVAPFYGNFGIVLRAYAYTIMLGREGLKRVAENAVLNANYIMKKLEPFFDKSPPRRPRASTNASSAPRGRSKRVASAPSTWPKP